MSNIEKIRKEIERRKKENMYVDLPMSIGRYYEDRDILAFIDSLPEEKATCKTCGFYENNCPFIRGKLIPYPNKVCKDYTYSAMKEQEKPSDDLEEAAARYERENRQSILSSVDIVDAFIAGAEWQARQLLKGSPLPEDTVLFQKGVEEGKRLMMEDAVEGRVHLMGFHNAIYSKEPDWTDYLDGFNEGDKVKIIIVKQDAAHRK